MQGLSAPLARAARRVATRLASAGQRGWIVGGSVRDLALGREAGDVDMASAAHPDEVERLFERTIAVGRAFGTVIVLVEGVEVQHTTFRSEAGYADGRRPDAVQFGASVEEDAQRRDFTANALYLDPLSGEVRDPTGGLADLEARRLRCVGDPAERFREDGLRLIRLARFAAGMELAIEPATLEAARANAAALRGVSPERVLAELETIFSRPRSALALEILAGLGLLERALPGCDGAGAAAWSARRAAFGHLPAAPGLELGLAVLYGPALERTQEFDADAHLDALERLRVSRATRHGVGELWRLARAIDACSGLPASRAVRVRWIRAPAFRDALALARAWRAARGAELMVVDALDSEASTLDARSLQPALFIGPRELEAAAVPRGPAWGALIEEAETLQLDLVLRDAESARAWLARRAAEIAQDGGKTLRKAKDKG